MTCYDSRDINGSTFKNIKKNIIFYFYFQRDFENMGFMAKQNMTITAKK